MQTPITLTNSSGGPIKKTQEEMNHEYHNPDNSNHPLPYNALCFSFSAIQNPICRRRHSRSKAKHKDNWRKLDRGQFIFPPLHQSE